MAAKKDVKYKFLRNRRGAPYVSKPSIPNPLSYVFL